MTDRDLRESTVHDPALYQSGEIHAVWSWLREHEPVRWYPVEGPGRGFWAVTRYVDVHRVIRNHLEFTSERGTLLNLLGRGDPAAGSQLAATDPPRHDRMRAPLQRALGARPIEACAAEIRSGIRSLLEPGLDGSAFDLTAAMAQRPRIALGSLLSLPEDDRPALVQLVAMCNTEEDPDFQIDGDIEATLRHGHRELFAYFSDLVRARVRHPGDDLISLLATTEVDGRRPSVGSVVSNCYSMVLGAAGTLPHVPTAALVELDRNGGYAEWADAPDLLGSGVEEALRWSTPACNFMRHALADVEIAGVRVPAGDAVLACLGSADRDGSVFARPDVFDVRRSPNRHFAFGVGSHYCVGSQLARLTLRALFEILFSTFSDVGVVGTPVRVHSSFLHGYKSVVVSGERRT